MATISRLKVGQVLYSVERTRMGNTTMSKGSLYTVVITEIGDTWVKARWNGNPERKYYEATIKKWRVNKPEPRGTIFGMPNYK